MPSIGKYGFRQLISKSWQEALEDKKFQLIIKLINALKEDPQKAEEYCKQITALELGHKRFCLHFDNREYVFNNNQFPISKNCFQYIQELRIYQQPDNFDIFDDVFGHAKDIKRFLIWDKCIPEKYCEILKNRNSLEESYVYSKHGFECLSFIPQSCQKLEVHFFKLENIKHLLNKASSYPSIEHLVVREAYFYKDFNTETVTKFCEFLSKTFPNLKQLDMDIDYFNKNSFHKSEIIDPDPRMFNAFPSEVKGSIKFSTFKFFNNFKECAEMVKNSSSSFQIVADIIIKKEIEIHDGLSLKSSVYFDKHEISLAYHPFFGYKNPPFGPFWLQQCPEPGSFDGELTD